MKKAAFRRLFLSLIRQSRTMPTLPPSPVGKASKNWRCFPLAFPTRKASKNWQRFPLAFPTRKASKNWQRFSLAFPTRKASKNWQRFPLAFPTRKASKNWQRFSLAFPTWEGGTRSVTDEAYSPQYFRSRVRSAMACEICEDPISSLWSRSAMVRAILITLS